MYGLEDPKQCTSKSKELDKSALKSSIAVVDGRNVTPVRENVPKRSVLKDVIPVMDPVLHPTTASAQPVGPLRCTWGALWCKCTNLVASYACTCANGFQLRSGGTICDDITNVQQRTEDVHRNVTIFLENSHVDVIVVILAMVHTVKCVNTAGSYRCECPTGFNLDSNRRSCSDHDECLSHHGCQHTCNNFVGSFFCSCHSGYALKKDNRTCSDVDECTPVYVASLNKTVMSAGCDQLCHNTPGNYTCSCNQGYQLLYDGSDAEVIMVSDTLNTVG
ncbi:TB domain [Desmophyllum pertusum]|uniref:TB domain n=1 Tax=Desmophyllum pertusum TaxID=174260 RepID=A0A9W9YA20_9CNID|nr:TB domain [Desmophyllum pertusum]